jgi:hypothetical protein
MHTRCFVCGVLKECAIKMRQRQNGINLYFCNYCFEKLMSDNFENAKNVIHVLSLIKD